MNEQKLSVYSVTISATRDGLDPECVIADADWSEAWKTYERIMTEAVTSVFPAAEVDVLEQASVRSIQVGEANGRSDEAAVELDDVVEAAYTRWAESI